MLITLTKADLLGAASNSVYNLGHFAAGGLVAFAVQKAAFKIFNLDETEDSFTTIAVRGLAFGAGIAASYSLTPYAPVTCAAFTARKFLETAVMSIATICITTYSAKLSSSESVRTAAIVASVAIAGILYHGAMLGKFCSPNLFRVHCFVIGTLGAGAGSIASVFLD